MKLTIRFPLLVAFAFVFLSGQTPSDPPSPLIPVADLLPEIMQSQVLLDSTGDRRYEGQVMLTVDPDFDRELLRSLSSSLELLADDVLTKQGERLLLLRVPDVEVADVLTAARGLAELGQRTGTQFQRRPMHQMTHTGRRSNTWVPIC